MSKAVFTLPAKVKPIAPSTAKNYKTHLNHLAAFEIDSVDAILKDPEEVIKVIDTLVSFTKDVEKKKANARVYYSALFYVLYEHDFLKDPDNILRVSFKRFRPKFAKNGEKWMPVEQYKKSQE